MSLISLKMHLMAHSSLNLLKGICIAWTHSISILKENLQQVVSMDSESLLTHRLVNKVKIAKAKKKLTNT